ncbi:MAG: type II secretion system GspH family protein [Proteobacteria bacterium]|nr:type II secretion system GspH family protein [Pseudomonadota bacterium]
MDIIDRWFHHSDKKKGFTFLEIVVTLLLVGIMGAISGMGITQVTRAYLFVRESASLTQDSQLVLNRMSRTIKNLTEIDTDSSDTNSTKLTLTCYRDGKDVTETYYSSGTSLRLKTTIDGVQTDDLLAENVSNFTLSYIGNRNGTATNWLTDKTPANLAKVQIDLSLALTNGTNVPFSISVIPRNIYKPIEPADFSDEYAGLENVSCFISTASGGDTMTLSHVVSSLIHFSQCYLDFWTELSSGQILSFALMFCLTWILFSCIKQSIQAKYFPQRQKGGALLGVVVTMVIIGILGGAMVSIISTSDRGAAVSMFNQRSYYLAESAYRYVAYQYLSSNGNLQSVIAMNAQDSFAIRNGDDEISDSFRISTSSYWFKAAPNTDANLATLEAKPAIRYPATYQGTLNANGSIVYNSATGLQRISYSKIKYPASGGDNDDSIITLTTTQSIPVDTEVYPASLIASGNDTLNEGGTLKLSESITPFPEKNGVFRLVMTNGTPGDPSDDDVYILLYESANPVTNEIKNISSALTSLANIPATGITVTAADYVYLDQNVQITASGQSGSNNYLSNRELHIYQPLFRVNVVLKNIYKDKFDNLNNWKTGAGNGELGHHSIVAVDNSGVEGSGSNNAIKVDETAVKSTASLLKSSYFDKSIQESVIEAKPSSNFGNFGDIFTKSKMTLSYDLQVKVKFSKEDDRDLNNPFGTYMPGVLFRVRPTETDPSLKEYYGLSFVRSIFKKGTVTKPDLDDIPDQGLFDDHGKNDKIDTSDVEICIPDYEDPPRWDDKPPLSGVPYLMVWEQVVQIVEYDNGLWRRKTTGDSLILDWLSWFPMCDVSSSTVDIYHYLELTKSGKTYPEATYEGRLSSDDPRRGDASYEKTYKAYKLIDTYHIFESDTVDGKTVFGTVSGFNTGYLVRNPSTHNYTTFVPGDVIENTAYVFSDESTDIQKARNYRLYLKPWVTMMARISEIKDNFVEPKTSGCDNALATEEKNNIIQAWFASPDDYPRGEYIFWPDTCDSCFTQAIWPDNAYNSRMYSYDYKTKVTIWPGIVIPWTVTVSSRICERGTDDYTSDDNKRSPRLLSSQLITPDDYADDSPSEVGLHTFGIDASDADVSKRETVYFDDFGLVVSEYAEHAGLLAGVQYE